MDFIHLYEIEQRNLLKLSGVEKGLRGRDNGGYITNVQCKANWNCHYESLLYNKYIPTKNIKIKQEEHKKERPCKYKQSESNMYLIY
jgi:hypothetical protein